MVWWKENLTDKSSVRVSNRASDVQMGRKQGKKKEKTLWISLPASLNGVGKIFVPLCKKSRDAPELIRAEKQKVRILDRVENSKIEKESVLKVGKESRFAEKSEAGQSGRLKEKRADLSENRETAGEIRQVVAKSQNKNNV